MKNRERKVILSAAFVLVGLVAVSIATPSGAAAARTRAAPKSGSGARPGDAPSKEAAFVGDINSLRASRGLPALQVNANLVRKARSWAATMAAARRIWHSTLPLGITTNWHKLGENVGMGGSEPNLHAAFVVSPKHFENLVDPTFQYVGVGIVDTGGVIFVSEVFMQLEAVSRRPAIPVHRPLKPGDATWTGAAASRTARPPLLFRFIM